MNLFTKEWVESYLQQIRNSAGNRYSPELNVDLPISEIFDGISRNKRFYIEIRSKYGEMLKNFKFVESSYENKELSKKYTLIKNEIDQLFNFLGNIKIYDVTKIPWDKINKQSKTIEKSLWEFADRLREEKDRLKDIKPKASVDGSYQSSPSERVGYNTHYVYEVQKIVRDFNELSLSTKAKLSNNPFLVLTGSAGSGKTHLLCDLAEQRTKANLPAFLVFGENFTNGNFWNQLLRQLGLNTTVSRFLKEVNLLGKRNQCRALIIVDAINENIESAPNFWKRNLTSIFRDIKKYPNISLIVSARNGFENEVFTESQKKVFIQEEHSGFKFREWEAVNKFFSSFNLPLPEVPLLLPEFQRPLFLLLFCKAFTKRKNKVVFKGHEGATFIFEHYVDTISKKIEKSFGIGHGSRKNVWDTVIEKIAEEMVTNNNDRISERALIEIIKRAHPKIDIGKFIRTLESNLLVVKVPRYTDGERVEGFDIRFPFQKFSDHLIGRYIFKKYEKEFGKANKNIDTAKLFFSSKRKLGKFILRSFNRGIIETLSVQTPEQLRGIEFLDILSPKKKSGNYLDEVLNESFIESLVWRNPSAFSGDLKNTLDIINQRIIRTKSGYTHLLNAFLSVAPIPEHPFNAEKLHNHLNRFTMPQRDAWWSTSFLHYQYGEKEAVDRLLQWSWSDRSFSHISDESTYLTAVTLSWFLTTPNRFIRDKATKGLVSLLQKRINLIEKLLVKFENVNDPYIIERLYAVAYGCILRNRNDKEELKSLAQWVFKKNFQNNPPMNVLIRDYTRGIIELAIQRKLLNKPQKVFNPPYKSKWPGYIPNSEDIKKKYYPEGFFNHKTEERGYLDIWSSVMYNSGSLGDFGNYVLNSHLNRWSGRKMRKPEPNRKELFEKFKAGLNPEQSKLLEKATNPLFGVKLKNLLRYIEVKEPSVSSLNEKQIEEAGTRREERRKQFFSDFKSSISKKKRAYFEKEIESFMDSNQSVHDPFDDFNTSLAQAWIVNRVGELGFDPKIHGEFDSSINRYGNSGRSEHKAERLGKKYQWIALHEFMAMVSDNFEFKGYSWNDDHEKYKGPWNPLMRDIDTSFIVQTDQCLRDVASFENWKTGEGKYDAWEKTRSDTKWLQEKNNTPNPKQIIRIIDDRNRHWLTLKGVFVWQEDTPPEIKKYDIPTREVFYILKSYVVKKRDYKKITSWLFKKGYGNWLPEAHEFYECFIGEYPNSYAFDDLRGNFNIWTKTDKTERGAKGVGVPVVVLDDKYLNEFTLDCSHDSSVSIRLPSKWLVNEMGLDHKYLDGRFFDKSGNLIAYTTSIFEEFFPPALLIDEYAFINFLNKKGYAIFWTLLGEKQIIGGGYDFKGRLNISGVYGIMQKEKLIGKMTTKFEPPQ